MSWRGRKVTDPKPVVRGPLEKYGAESTKGLDPLYKGVDTAKSQLRSIEHRLQEAERTTNPPGIDSSHNVAVDRVPSYVLNPTDKPPVSILVDGSGKTRHLRTREEQYTRKVSRLDDKYRRQRSPPRDSKLGTERKVAWSEDLGSTGSTTTTTGYKSATGSTLQGLSSLDTRVMDSLTGTKGETLAGVNFLNDKDSGVLTKSGGVRGYLDLPGRWTTVDARIPGAGSSSWGRKTTSGVDPMASTFPPKASGVADTLSTRPPTEVDTNSNQLATSGSSAASAPPNVNATYTVNGESSGSTSPNSSRARSKRSLKDLESSDALAKLKEKIRQQKLAAANAEMEMPPAQDLHVTHNVDDPIVARAVPRTSDQPLVRKVAMGPAMPRYQGFSETKTEYGLPDGKVLKVADIRRHKLKKIRKEAPLKEKQRSALIDPDEKKTKPQRVVAPAKKPVKSDRQTGDIITTRSWRVGAKLVLQELGPNKLPKMSDSPPTKEKNDSKVGVKAGPLSSEAQSVLRDMEKSDNEEEEGLKGKEESKRAHKRKRSKPLSVSAVQDKQDDKQPKVRHYDADEIRKYMEKKRRDDKKKEQQKCISVQQQRAQREESLADLYKRQRGGAHTAPLSGGVQRRTDTGKQPLPASSIPTHVDAVKPSGESDKENSGTGAWGEVSSSESTLSGGSAAGTGHLDGVNGMDVDDGMTQQSAHLPSGSRPEVRQFGDAFANRNTAGAADGPTAAGLRSADSGLGATSASRLIADSGFTVNEILSKFAAVTGDAATPAHAVGSSTMPAYLREPRAAITSTPFSASTALAGASMDKEQRKRALIQNSSLLSHRVQSMASQAQSLSTQERWALPREEMQQEEPVFRSRYDRMTGRDPNVYDSELPGVGNLSRPLPKTTQREYQHMKPPEDDVASELSDATLHEDDLYQSLPKSKMEPAKIRLTSTAVQPAGGRNVDRPRPATKRWAEPRADPYSILNILSRRKDPLSGDPYKRVGLFDDTEPEEDLNDHTLNSDQNLSDNVSLSDDSTFTGEAPTDKDRSIKQRSHLSTSHHSASHHSMSHNSISQRSVSPVSVSQLSEDDSSLTDYTKSHSRPLVSQHSARSVPNGALSARSQHSILHSVGSLKAASIKSDKKTTLDEQNAPIVDRRGLLPPQPTLEPLGADDDTDDQDDTLEGPQSPTLASDLDGKAEEDDAMSIEISDVSESSDLSIPDRSAGNRRAYAPGGVAYRPGVVSGRLSPGGLERRMTAELNLLESMEESVRQLAGVDRTRGIALAQQESVSLAQILKAQEHGHIQQLAAYKRDADLMSRELTAAQRNAANASESAANSIERARQETTRSLQESTMNLIATQSEAAKATAEAARQLAEVKVASAGAAANINNESTSRLIHETALATATAVSSALQDRYGRRGGAQDHGTQYSSKRSVRPSGDSSYTSDTFESDLSQTVTSTHNTRTRSRTAPGSRPDSRVSYSRDIETASAGTSPAGTGSIKTGSIVTASDLSKNTAASIATESGVGGIAGSQENSKSESIIEEDFTGKIPDDYSIDFDTSVTEEEMEKSLREVLPSQDHRKKIKRTSSQSDLSSVASDDHKEALSSLGGGNARRLSFEGDSFTKFQMGMVRQYIQEEEIRAQHQGALLKLRERALKEKTQAELAWLEQQKKRSRDKGADEAYPLIKKRRRGLLLKLQQEQAEIKRLKEANRAAQKERQFLLLQSQGIQRMQESTVKIMQETRRGGADPHVAGDKSKVEQWLFDLDSSTSIELDTNSSKLSQQVKEKMKTSGVEGAAELTTEDEMNFNLDDSDIISITSPSKDSEGGEQKADHKVLQKLRKMKLDDKFLTHREQQLHQRRMQLEGLLEWKQKLDREEKEIELMERAAYSLTAGQKAPKEKSKEKSKDKPTKDKPAKDSYEKSDKKEKEKLATTPRTPRADTIASELDSIKEESFSEASFTATTSAIRTRRTPRTETDIPEDVPPDSARSVKTTSSIGEEIITAGKTSSNAEDIPTTRSGKRTPDSSEEANVTSSTTHEEYTNETFESDVVTTTVTAQTATTGPAAKGQTAPPRLQLGAKDGAGPRTTSRSPKSPLKSPIRRGSESESEDSMSIAHSETASDQSDLENRIRALSEDLKRRKSEAERLKKEAKKNQKERLRQEELALKKQIEAYDKYIAEARLEVTDEAVELQDRSPTVQPQIKKPSPGQKRSPPGGTKDTRLRIDSDGSRSSSSIENGVDSPGQTTPLSPITPGGPEEVAAGGKVTSFADSISESLLSPHLSALSQKKTSTPEDKSTYESRSRTHVEHSETIDEVPEEVSGLAGLEESETSEVKLRLDISKTEDIPDSTRPPVSEAQQQPTTARSLKSITEDVQTDIPEDSRPLSRADSRNDTSVAHSKSEKVTNGMVSEKSLKSQYSSDLGDDYSDRSVSHKSDKSFTYSSSRTATSKTSRSKDSYTDEYTEATTGKSSPRRKDPTTGSKKSSKEEIEEESIQTEEEVSEQLDEQSDDDNDDGEVLFNINTAPAPVVKQAAPVDPLSHLQVGDRVLVGGARPGVLRFKGTVKFADGFFGGIELNKPEGTNNGSKDGVVYFTCPPSHGLFAPPEKLEPLPENWKDEEAEVSGAESDLSEATIHDGEEDAEKIAELRKDVTKPESEPKPLSMTKDGDESIAEDVSVATTVDSELERVISSAAAAVESFGAEQLEEPHSGTVSPVDTTVSDALSPREPTPTAAADTAASSIPLEKVVDSITDGILHMVVKDSVQSAGEVVAKRQSGDAMLAAVTAPAPQEDLKSKPATKPVEKKQQAEAEKTESNSEAVELATQKLLTESISQMLSIYKKKKDIEPHEEQQAASPEAVQRTTSPTDGSVDPSQEAGEQRKPDILTLDDAGFDPFPGLSDDFGAGKKKVPKAKKAAMMDDLDQLYDEIGALTGDTDEWFDDDFGLGKRAPPPYPGTQQEKIDKSESNELRLDLRRVTQEPFFAVPHRAEEVRNLTNKAVDHYWELRRFGESWSDVNCAPDEFFKSDELRAADMESSNRRAYKQLVFNLTGEVLTDIYQAEENETEDPCSWMPPRRHRQKYYRGREPPTVRDLIEPIVEDQVLKLTGLKQSDRSDVRLAKWSSRKKRDRVDNVLLTELVEEEPDWVDYNEDETTVKMQIADSIFDSLLVETATIFTSIAQRRQDV